MRDVAGDRLTIERAKTWLPRSWEGHPAAVGLVAESEFPIKDRGDLRFKVLVFDQPSQLLRFWTRALGRGPAREKGTRIIAGVQEIGRECAGKLIVDPRYFCVAMFCVGYHTRHIESPTLVVAHEAVHIGIAYAARTRRDCWVKSGNLEDEKIAYPAGIAAYHITKFMNKHKLF